MRLNNPKPKRLEFGPEKDDIWCESWAVITPGDSKWASEAVRRQVTMYEWCLVIVFEEEPFKTYDPRWFIGEGGNKAIVTLSAYQKV